jgi:tetratricopeptide (TPR) repeat protein
VRPSVISLPATSVWLSIALCGLLQAAPATSELERQGLDALAAQLPDVAAARFTARLESQPTDAEETKRLRLLLGEALVRANQPESALSTLDHPTLADSTLALFWKAQAHRANGSLQRAIELLDQVIDTKDFPFYGESILTRSRLLSALGNQRAAIAGLNLLTTTKSPLATRAKLDQTRLLLTTGQIEDARKTLPSTKTLKSAELFDALLLDAALLQAESKFSQAAAAYKSILAQYQKEDDSLPTHIHPAAIGLARALASMGQRAEATDALLAFLQNQPDSPNLDEAFALLRPLLLSETREDDPVVSLIKARLDQWSLTPPAKNPAIFPDSSAGAADHPPAILEFPHPELHAQSLFLRIVGLGKSTEIERLEEQRRLVTQLRWEHSDHPLSAQATVELARTLFQNKQFEKARYLLENLIDSQAAGSTEVEAHLILANQLYQNQEFAQAAASFEKAASSLQSTARSNAQFNAGIAWLVAGDPDQVKRLQAHGTPKLMASLQLEQALYAASQQPEMALPLLDRFIVDHPTHARLNEARLAMAFCALEQVPPAISKARALLDSLDEESLLAEHVLLAKIQLAIAANQNAECIALCREFLKSYPDSPQFANVTLALGTSLYQNGDLSDARQTLQKLEKTHPEKAAPALLIAARAAARTGTPQSLAEAIELFDRIIQSKSSLASFASLEKARTLIDAKSTASLQQAAKELEALYQSLEKNPPLQITAGLLWMETLYSLGGAEPARHDEGLALQRKLLVHPGLGDDDRNRINYYRGLTLEHMNQPDQALDVYYQVVESASKQVITNWDYFERCGFNAIALLEKNRRWESAIAIAKKIATFPCPRAKEAEERASRLGLEHMILDE